jgi:DNA-directed RNA polymerase subunit RPC12/RpoP
MIEFACDCGKLLRVKDEYAGRRVHCPACGVRLVVPVAAGLESRLAAVAAEAATDPSPVVLPPDVPKLARVPAMPTPEPREPSRRGSFVRWLLYIIAMFSGIYTVLSPFMAEARRARSYQDVSYAKYVGNLAGIIDAERKVGRDEDEAGANARTALIVFTVALAGLAAPREWR